MFFPFHYYFYFLLLSCFASTEPIPYSSERNEKIKELASDAYKKWSMMESMSTNPDCWKRAYMIIHGSCMEMGQDDKLQFAWNILVCYYEDTGRSIPKCSSPSIRVCTSNLSNNDFDIYTQLYNHCDSFCFYRESKEWQAQTDASIRRLEDSTQQTIQKLDESISQEEKLLSLQTKNLELHSSSLLQSSRVLEKISQAEEQLEIFHSDFHSSFNSLKNITEGYFDSIRSISNWTQAKIDSLSSLNQLMHTTFHNSQCLLTILFKVCISFFITSIPGLTSLRPYLYLFILLSLFIERLFSFSPFSIFPETVQHWCEVICKGIVMILLIIHFIKSKINHKDWDYENYELLVSLNQQIQEYHKQYEQTHLHTPQSKKSVFFSPILSYKTKQQSSRPKMHEDDLRSVRRVLFQDEL